MDVTKFGAVGDGQTDDAAAITRALAALQPGQALKFPAGKVFCHASVLVVNTPRVQLLGPGTLRATAESQSALQVNADGVVIDGLTLAIASTTQRWSTPQQHKLFLGTHDGIIVRDVMITGSAAAGLFCFGSSNFVLAGVHVSDTRADGIHMTYGSHSATVLSPVIARSGDDGVAVVSYLQDGAFCHDITVTAPTVQTTTGGRGLSVVGGQNVTYTDIAVSGSNAASVYISCEGAPSNTYPTSAVRVNGGTITDANTNASIDHGAVLVYSGRSGGSVSDVVISGLQITDTRTTASRQIGVIADSSSDAVSEITFSDLRLDATPTPYQGNAPAGSYVLTGVTAAGSAVSAPK
jgi:hypothetical protein